MILPSSIWILLIINIIAIFAIWLISSKLIISSNVKHKKIGEFIKREYLIIIVTALTLFTWYSEKIILSRYNDILNTINTKEQVNILEYSNLTRYKFQVEQLYLHDTTVNAQVYKRALYTSYGCLIKSGLNILYADQVACGKTLFILVDNYIPSSYDTLKIDEEYMNFEIYLNKINTEKQYGKLKEVYDSIYDKLGRLDPYYQNLRKKNKASVMTIINSTTNFGYCLYLISFIIIGIDKYKKYLN